MRTGVLCNPALAALMVAGVAQAGAPPRVTTGVVFGRAGEVDLLLDLYQPAVDAAAHPAVVFVHGGGWTGGSRGAFAQHATDLAGRGYVAISVDYRLAPAHTYPAALDDVQLAVRWLRSKAAELRVDPERIGAVGSSAGGHLVACLGVRDTRDPAAPLAEHSSRARVVVDIHGIHDLPSRDTGGTRPFLGVPLADDPALWRDASPLTFVSVDSAPVFLAHDPGDETVDYAQSAVFAAALIKAGVPVWFEPTPGSGHGYVYNLSRPWAQRVWPLATAWLDRYLGG